MEFLRVHFPESREVRVDGLPHGKTDFILQLEAGDHDVTLGPPYDFSPIEQTVRLSSTAALAPCEITFHRLPASAVPISPGTPA